MGASRAARAAGYTPKMRPTPAATATEMSTGVAVTVTAIDPDVARGMTTPAAIPTTTPRTPPTTLSVAASTRN